MATSLTPIQKRHVENIITKVGYYMDIRYQQARKFNPAIERGWEDLAAQQLNVLRISLSNEKMFGPVRYNVAELLVSDDARKRAELFMRKSQNCLAGEILELKDTEGHKTAGAMEVHDLRTLCNQIDPLLDRIVVLVQTFIWWDLEDACDWARYENKARLIQRLQEGGLTEEMAQYYRDLMQADHKPSVEEAVVHEAKGLRVIVEALRVRRTSEPGYQMIMRREQAAAEQPEMMIDAIAGQQNILRQLRAGAALPPMMVEQLAKAMGMADVAAATNERMIPFVENLLATNRKRLKDALNGVGTGTQYNVKMQQLTEFEAQLAQYSDAAGAPAAG